MFNKNAIRCLFPVLLIAIVLTVPVLAFAEQEVSLVKGDDLSLSLGGQYRAKFLFNSGKDFNNENEDFESISQRFRLNTKAVFKNSITVFAQIQDVRVWGEESDTLKDYSADSFDLHQGFGEVKISDSFLLKIGRQELVYDGQRLVGSVGFLDQARSFDAAKGTFKFDSMKIEIFYSKLAEKHSSGEYEKDKDFSGIWVNSDKSQLFKPSFIFLLDTDYKAKKTRYTTGMFLKGILSSINYKTEFYYQFGDIGEKSIAAMLGSVELGYKMKIASSPSLNFFIDYVSGDNNVDDNEIKSFDTLFATNHKYYGFMDFFINVPAHTKNKGLMDMGAKASFSPVKKSKMIIHFHKFSLTEKDSSSNTDLGWELDAVYKYKLKEKIGCTAGYSIFSPGDSMIAMKENNEDMEHFGFFLMNFIF